MSDSWDDVDLEDEPGLGDDDDLDDDEWGGSLDDEDE